MTINYRPACFLSTIFVPVVRGDHVIGAIASSGSTGNEDDKCATLGAEKIQAGLKRGSRSAH